MSAFIAWIMPWLGRAVLGLSGVILEVVTQYLIDKNVFERTVAVARDVVQHVDTIEELTSEQKRAEAVSLVKEALRAAGEEVQTSAVNLGVEIAVAGMRAAEKDLKARKTLEGPVATESRKSRAIADRVKA